MKNAILFSAISGLFFIFLCDYSCAQSFVPVRDEPHHKVILENDYVRLIDVHIQPGDTTLIHKHEINSVIVFLTNTKIGSQTVGEQPTIAPVIPGYSRFSDFGERPVTHRVWNADTSAFHVMDIELVKQNVNADSCPIINDANVELALEQNLVRVYNLKIDEGKFFEFSKNNCAYLLIVVSGEISTTPLKDSPYASRKYTAGEYAWYSPESGGKISSSNGANCVLLELK